MNGRMVPLPCPSENGRHLDHEGQTSTTMDVLFVNMAFLEFSNPIKQTANTHETLMADYRGSIARVQRDNGWSQAQLLPWILDEVRSIRSIPLVYPVVRSKIPGLRLARVRYHLFP